MVRPRAVAIGSVLVVLCLACSAPKRTPPGGDAPAAAPYTPRDDFERLIEAGRLDPDGVVERHQGDAVTVRGVLHSAGWADKRFQGPHAVVTVGNPRAAVVALFGSARGEPVLALRPGEPVEIVGRLHSLVRDPQGAVSVIVDGCELAPTPAAIEP